MLRNILRFAVCVTIVCVLLQSSQVSAQQNETPVPAGSQSGGADEPRVPLYDGLVSFVPPRDFSRLSEELIAVKFPEAKGPAIVYGNTRATVSIAITYPPQRMLRPEQLPALQSFLESTLVKQKKGLEWLRKEIVEFKGQKWMHLEFISQAIDTKIHNHMFLTSLDERMLLFNFNSTVEAYDAHKDALMTSRDSIRIEAKK